MMAVAAMKLKQLALWCMLGIALALVFAAYLRPDIAFTLANQLWQCF